MRPEGQANGRTDVTKLIIAFRKLTKAPNKNSHFPFSLTDADDKYNCRDAVK
jgi:hypothetical protein